MGRKKIGGGHAEQTKRPRILLAVFKLGGQIKKQEILQRRQSVEKKKRLLGKGRLLSPSKQPRKVRQIDNSLLAREALRGSVTQLALFKRSSGSAKKGARGRVELAIVRKAKGLVKL